MIAIYFEHFFEPLIGQQTFLKAYLTAQKSCVKLLSNYLRAQKSGFNLLSAFLSEFFFLSALLSTQKHTQGTSEPLWKIKENMIITQQKVEGQGFLPDQAPGFSNTVTPYQLCQC